MRIHHLNCGTLRPFGRRRVNGDGLPFQVARMVCHCLLVETSRGLVLVDTGFGLHDIAEGRGSLVRSFLPGASKLERGRVLYPRFGIRAGFDRGETAVRQVAELGYSAGDVTDVVLTPLDRDHAGGLRDFPSGKVHLLDAERSAAMRPAT